MANPDDGHDRPKTLFQSVKGLLLAPIRLALSPALLRTYLRTALLLIASSILFTTAVVAYTSFYYAYIPIRGISVPVYLQYDPTPYTPGLATPSATTLTSHRAPRHPYAIANIHGLVPRQKYDVLVVLDLPRSAPNLAAGNWMVSLELRGATALGAGVKNALGWDDEWDVEDYSQGAAAGRLTERVPPTDTGSGSSSDKPVVLARSRRPALIPYKSPLVELAHRMLRLPLYAVGFGLESETVQLNMMEGVQFERGWRNVPSSLRVEVRARAPLDVYNVRVKFVARLEGLRWVMYRHWVVSAVVFTAVFWGVEMALLLGTWALFAVCFGAGAERDTDDGRVKREDGGKGGGATAATQVIKEGETGLNTPGTATSESERRPPTPATPSEEKRVSKMEGGGEQSLNDVPVKKEKVADNEGEGVALDELRLQRREKDSGLGTSLERGPDRAAIRRRSDGPRGGS